MNIFIRLPTRHFEELISNSWDANATEVYVRIPGDLKLENAAIWILDNGTSMNVSGFEQLWSIASSSKRNTEIISGRKQIGKFGIGKLATYVLANELTYICKAKDGVIRIITMDYRLIDEAKSSHIDQLPLSVGYNNLSNFSIAFKNKFGINPSEITS